MIASLLFLKNKSKSRRRCSTPPVKLRFSNSYDGIIRIRSKGRRCILPLSLSKQAPLLFRLYHKTGDTTMPPVKNIVIFDFLRRHYPHQVKGSKFDNFLSACSQAPLFCNLYLPTATFHHRTGILYTILKQNSSIHSKKLQKVHKYRCHSIFRALPRFCQYIA